MPLTGPQLLHAIKRNFGGLEDPDLDPIREFQDKFPSNIDSPPHLTHVSPEVSCDVVWSFKRLGLFRISLCLLAAPILEPRQLQTRPHQDQPQNKRENLARVSACNIHLHTVTCMLIVYIYVHTSFKTLVHNRISGPQADSLYHFTASTHTCTCIYTYIHACMHKFELTSLSGLIRHFAWHN